MFKWLREYYELKMDLATKKRELQFCESCETLKQQLAIANENNRDLLNRLMVQPEPETKINTDELKPIGPRNHLSWRVRQQILEREDREKAKILKERESAIKPSTDGIEELEKEMDIAAQEREGKVS